MVNSLKEEKSDNNTTFRFVSSSSKLTLQTENVNVSYDVTQKRLTNKSEININKFFKEIIDDKPSINTLETIIKDSINFHAETISKANLPKQIDIEFIRTSRLEQLIHALNPNKIKEPYGNSTIRASTSDKFPIIRISTDFVKDFYQFDSPKFGHPFIDKLKDEFNTSNDKKIITELTFLHELGHIVFDEKIKNTFLKRCYELNNEKYLIFNIYQD